MDSECNSPPGLGRHVPPCMTHVYIYFQQKGISEADASAFFAHFEQRNWTGVNGKLFSNWKTLACDWIWELCQYRRHSAVNNIK